MSIGAGASCVHTSRERAICHTFSGAVTAAHCCLDSPSAFPLPPARAAVDLLFEGIREVTADVTDGASLVSHGSVWRGKSRRIKTW